MNLTELACKNCGAPLDGDDVSIEHNLAKCRHCNTVFALGDAKGAPATPEKPTRAPVGLPNGIEVEDIGNAIQIKRRWFGIQYLLMIPFCLFWNGFMVAWHIMALASGAWFMSLFGLIHTGVGVGIAYFTLAGLLNTTTIRAGMGVLEIQHAPLPWRGSQTLVATDLQQLYSKETKHHRSKGGVSYSYELHATTTAGEDKTLLSGLQNEQQALYIEQELERFLQIEDTPVRGEIAR